MRSLSVNQSLTSLDTCRQVFHSQITKDYFQQKNDQLLQYLDDLVKESNPKEQYKMIIEKRMKEKRQLQDQNRKLIFRNKQLEDELRMVKDQVRRLKNNESQSQQQENGQMSIQSPPSSTSKSNQSQGQSDQLALVISPENQHQELQTIKELHTDAQQIAQQQKSLIEKSMILLQRTFEKLEKIVKLQKYDERVGMLDDSDKDTIIVDKKKYEMLVDCYVQGVVMQGKVKRKVDQGEGQQQQIVEEFVSTQNHNEPQKQVTDTVLTTSTQLQKLFTKLAITQNLSYQWQQYLQTRKTEAEQFKHAINMIVKGSPQAQSKLEKNIEQINDTTISYKTNQLQQSAAVLTTQKCQAQIEEQLFVKLHEILKLLQFEPKEKQLFHRFDQMRKCGKLFDVEEFVQKFKSKQDLFYISKEYTNYMFKTMNSLVIFIMQILTQQTTDRNNPQQNFPWLRNKLDKKSTQLKTNLQLVLQKQCAKYLQEKKPSSLDDPLQQRKIIQPILTPKFDSDREYELQLIKIVMQYRELVNSCVVNSNRRTMVKLV